MARLQMRAFFLPKLWFRGDLGLRARRYTRAVLYTFNLHTLVLLALACVSVYVCDRLQFSFNMDFSLCALGSTFPLVFAIQSAFSRRERALSTIAQFKASAVALYYMHRDWAQDCDYPASMGNNFTAAARACRLLLADLCRAVREYLTAHMHYESAAEARFDAARLKSHAFGAEGSIGNMSQVSFAEILAEQRHTDPGAEALRRCYAAFSRLSVLNERLTAKSGYSKGGEGGMSRTNQYLRYMIAGVEELRMLREYRTPIMMRYANGVLVHVFSVCLGPFFAHYCGTGPGRAVHCAAGYLVASVYVVIVMLLYNIAVDLEQPFDAVGLDDVWWSMEEEVVEHTVDAAFLPGTAAQMGTRLPSYDDLSAAFGPASPGHGGAGGAGAFASAFSHTASRLWAEAHAAACAAGAGASPRAPPSRAASIDKLAAAAWHGSALALASPGGGGGAIRAHRPAAQASYAGARAGAGESAPLADEPPSGAHSPRIAGSDNARGGVELSFSGQYGLHHLGAPHGAGSTRLRGVSAFMEEETAMVDAAIAEAAAEEEAAGGGGGCESEARPLVPRGAADSAGGAKGGGGGGVKGRCSLRTSKSD